MAKHAGETEGWSHAIGRANRRPAYRPTYGKHGNGHVGNRESRRTARFYRAARRLNGRPRIGRHGMAATHPVALRVIGASVGRRVIQGNGTLDPYAAGIRYRAIVGA